MFTHPSRMIRLLKWNKFVSHKHQLSKCFEKHILALSNAQPVAPEIPINLPKNQKLPDKKKKWNSACAIEWNTWSKIDFSTF